MYLSIVNLIRVAVCLVQASQDEDGGTMSEQQIRSALYIEAALSFHQDRIHQGVNDIGDQEKRSSNILSRKQRS